MVASFFTPYPDINQVLQRLLDSVRCVLGEQFVGLYLYGSLASGDFTLETSDIDFLVITQDFLSPEAIVRVEEVHSKITRSSLIWAAKLEGSYMPLALLPRYDPVQQTPLPTLNEGRFYLASHGWDWVLQRHVLRQSGVTIAGPDIRPIIELVTPDELRHAVRELLKEWWQPMLVNPERLQADEYQAYAILSMCRALYTLKLGEVASKPASARWAIEMLGEPWAERIENALRWKKGEKLGMMAEAVELIGFTILVASF